MSSPFPGVPEAITNRPHRGSLLPGIAWIMGARLFALALGLGTAAILARGLGPSGMGLFAVAMLTPTLAVLLFGGGLSSANTYFAGGGADIGALISNTAAISVVGTTVAAIVLGGLYSVGATSTVLAGVTPGVLLLCLGASFVLMLRQALNAIVLGRQQVSKSARVDVAQAVAYAVSAAGFVGVLDLGVPGAVAAYLVALIVAVGLLIYWLRHLSSGAVLRLDGTLARQTISYGYRGSSGAIAQFFTYRLDLLLVNAWTGSSPAGLYAVATRVAELLWLLPSAVGTMIFARSSASTNADMNKITPKAFWATLAVTALAAAALAVVGRDLIALVFSVAFESAIQPLLILLPGAVLLGASGILANDLAGRGHIGTVTIAALVGAFVTVVLDLLLIPGNGATGAAMASSIAYVVYFIAVVAIYLRLTGDEHDPGSHRLAETPG